MAKKVSKKEWDQFLADDSWWDGLCYDECLFVVNGQEEGDVDPQLDDETVISIEGGIVCDQETMQQKASLIPYLRKWQKQQQVRQVVVEVPNEVTDRQLKDQLKAINAKVRS